MARPTKLTPDLQARMCELLRAGNYIETAARACGISTTTHYDWVARGAEEATAPPDPRSPRKRLDELVAERGLEPPAKGSGRGGRVVRADLIELLATAPGPYRAYRDAVEEAMTAAETDAVTLVAAAAKNDWRAAAWYLERAHPEHWRRRSVRSTPRSPDAPEGPDTPEDQDEPPPARPPVDHTMSGPDGEPL